jgi:hypothetical protein
VRAEIDSRPSFACIVGTSDQEVWCDSAANRLHRSLARAGLARVVAEADLPDEAGAVMLLRADCVIDGPLLQALLKAPGAVLLSNGAPAGVPVAVHAPAGLAAAAAELLRQQAAGALPPGLSVVTSAGLGASYWQALRKREDRYALVLRAENL